MLIKVRDSPEMPDNFPSHYDQPWFKEDLRRVLANISQAMCFKEKPTELSVSAFKER